MGQTSNTLDDFYDLYEEDENGCWYWLNAPDNKGYPRMSVDGERWAAHRLSYAMHIGHIPDDMVVDHLCDTPMCVNPDHLQLLSSVENVMRSTTNLFAVNARKTHCKRGHEFTSENTRVNSIGGRVCRACDNQRT